MSTQGKLFECPVETKKETGKTCRSCQFRYKHQYGKMFYCRKQKQKGTAYGDKKIKAGDIACSMYNKL